jgi:hypothetical protein
LQGSSVFLSLSEKWEYPKDSEIPRYLRKFETTSEYKNKNAQTPAESLAGISKWRTKLKAMTISDVDFNS